MIYLPASSVQVKILLMLSESSWVLSHSSTHQAWPLAMLDPTPNALLEKEQAIVIDQFARHCPALQHLHVRIVLGNSTPLPVVQAIIHGSWNAALTFAVWHQAETQRPGLGCSVGERRRHTACLASQTLAAACTSLTFLSIETTVRQQLDWNAFTRSLQQLQLYEVTHGPQARACLPMRMCMTLTSHKSIASVILLLTTCPEIRQLDLQGLVVPLTPQGLQLREAICSLFRLFRLHNGANSGGNDCSTNLQLPYNCLQQWP